MQHPLVSEAILISKEITDAVFVGAVAVFIHTNASRESQDLDFAVVSTSIQDILEMGYTRQMERGKNVLRTPAPRNYKIDIYTRDVSGVPVEIVVDSAKNIVVDKKGTKVKVAAIEVLSLTKFRAGRKQDGQDLLDIAKRKFNDFNWNFMESICYTKYEFDDIKKTLAHFNRR